MQAQHVSRLSASHVFKKESALCDWFSVLCIKLYLHGAVLFLIA